MLLANVAQASAESQFQFETEGFSKLALKIGDDVGVPVTPEYGTLDGTAQLTDQGLLYWRKDSGTLAFTDGKKRIALVSDKLVDWSGEDLDPPAAVLNPCNNSLGIRAYIALCSRHPALVDCVIGIESTYGLDMYNKTPHAGEHAQGFAGWLPSTASRHHVSIGSLASEVDGVDRMIESGEGGQFYGMGGWSGRYGTGPCFHR